MAASRTDGGVLATYLLVWSMHALASGEACATGGGQYPRSSSWLQHDAVHYALATFVIFAAWWPSIRTLTASHIAMVLIRLARVPRLFDGEYWSLWTDVTVLLAAASRLIDGSPVQLGHDADSIIILAASTARAQLVCCYFGAFFFKLNSSWHDARRSCASVLAVQVVSGWLPEWLTPEWLPAAVVKSAPPLSSAVELAIPSLLAMRGRRAMRCGLALGLLFHLLIALIPIGEANNAAGFSVLCAIRYVFFVPQAACTALHEARSAFAHLCTLPTARRGESLTLLRIVYWSVAAISVAIACAAMVMRRGQKWFDWYTSQPLYVGLFFFFVRALMLDAADGVVAADDAERRSNAPKLRRAAAASLLVGTAFQIFAMPILGLSDVGASHMYSNLRLYGGSNHYLVTTGWLHALAERRPTYFPAASAFSGGVVRVDDTDSAYLNAMFPGETTNLSPKTRAWLQAVGHSGRAFSSIDGQVLLDMSAVPRQRQRRRSFTPYRTTALEVRRLVDEARQHGGTFFLKYTRLPGEAQGHRPPATARGASVTFRHDGPGRSSCRARKPGAWFDGPCAADELPNLPAPSALASKFLLYTAHPVVSRDDDDDSVEDAYCLG